jgi:lipase maturation factor 1
VKSHLHVAAPPAKPLMIYDGDCNFCSRWIRRWQQATGDAVDYLPFQDARVAAQFPELPRNRFEAAVQLVEPEGAVFEGAEAVFRALAHKPHEHWLLDLYYHLPVFAAVSEWIYRGVAGHRRFFSAMTGLAWGRSVERLTYYQVRRLFLRSLAVVYLVAFVSLWTQITGLVGSEGIVPAKNTMSLIRAQMNAQHIGLDRFHVVPTLCWFSSSDTCLKIQCAAGTVLAVLVILGIAPAPCLFLLWLIYLSLSTVCVDFLSYQWDVLLLQTGFLAIFLAPLQLLPWRLPGRHASSRRLQDESPGGRASSRAQTPLEAQESRARDDARPPGTLENGYFSEASLPGEAPPSRLVIWLLRWLLFQLVFESGCIKLASGDLNWRHLTALAFHYETQPLPTWIAWYAHQLPGWFQSASAVFMFAVELVVPFLFFAPRRLRAFACGAQVLLQVLIMLTGNYGFFNLLTIALCVLLLDDAALRRLTRSGLRHSVAPDSQPAGRHLRRWPLQATFPVACVSIVVGLIHLGSLSRHVLPWPRPLLAVQVWLTPFRTFNSYGLFAVMTTRRLEIVIEGSNNGTEWQPYEFKYKPGDVKRRPRFVEPHQPRLDWQMWFAALSDFRNNPWILNFCVGLLQGSPSVLGLLERNPFPNAPPHYIRAGLYDYRFTDFATHRKTGAWWRRQKVGDYLPSMSLREKTSPRGDDVAGNADLPAPADGPRPSSGQAPSHH